MLLVLPKGEPTASSPPCWRNPTADAVHLHQEDEASDCRCQEDDAEQLAKDSDQPGDSNSFDGPKKEEDLEWYCVHYNPFSMYIFYNNICITPAIAFFFKLIMLR